MSVGLRLSPGLLSISRKGAVTRARGGRSPPECSEPFDELKLIDAPPLIVRLYERYLPAALALEVEQHWAERFATVFATQAAAHTPTWYSGDAWDTHDVGRFTSSFGSSFSSAISSSSTAPFRRQGEAARAHLTGGADSGSVIHSHSRVIRMEPLMATTMTVKGQVTIPKKVREALRLSPGDGVDFDVNREGQVVVHKVGARPASKRDRFESARGKAQVKWRTDELMALLRERE